MSGDYSNAWDVLLDLLPKSQHGRIEGIMHALRADGRLIELRVPSELLVRVKQTGTDRTCPGQIARWMVIY